MAEYMAAKMDDQISAAQEAMADCQTPRVNACIAAVMAQHPGMSKYAQAEYYEAVHQELAPLARELEMENAELRAQLFARGPIAAPKDDHA